jgi:hypothetical protein
MDAVIGVPADARLDAGTFRARMASGHGCPDREDGKRHGCRAALSTPLGDGTALGQTLACVIAARG